MEVFINTHGNPVPVAYGEWVDLYTAEDVVLEPLEFKIISLGVSMQLPKGKYAVMVPGRPPAKITESSWQTVLALSRTAIAATMISGAFQLWQSDTLKSPRARGCASSAL